MYSRRNKRHVPGSKQTSVCRVGPCRAQGSQTQNLGWESQWGIKLIELTYSNHCPRAAGRTWKIRKSLLNFAESQTPMKRYKTKYPLLSINIKYNEAQLRQISPRRHSEWPAEGSEALPPYSCPGQCRQPTVGLGTGRDRYIVTLRQSPSSSLSKPRRRRVT